MKSTLSLEKTLLALGLLISGGVVVGCSNPSDNPYDEPFKREIVLADEFKDCEMPELPGGYKIVWADEFNGEGQVDRSKWNYEIGNGSYGWGNNEKQYYTDSTDNSFQKDGSLHIVAKKESRGGCDYTSARMTTKNICDVKYGIVEARIKLPTGQGTWPAFWMMPSDSVYGGWPNSGEIDIMEAKGNAPDQILGTIHTGAYNHSIGTQKGSTKYVNGSRDNFNIYRLEWTEDDIRISVNGNEYFIFNKNPRLDQATNPSALWPFDQEFFIILNCAMGGMFGGNIDPNFSQAEMLVDYVRVYQKSDDNEKNAPSPVVLENWSSSSSTINLSWFDSIDDYKVRQYEIIVNNKTVGATINNSYTITGLNPNETYDIKVLACDWNDNYSLSENYKIKTKGAVNIPGEVDITGYGTPLYCEIAQNANGNVLRMFGGGSCNYQVVSSKEQYEIKIKASVLRQCEFNVYCISDGVKEKVATTSLKPTYGKYNEFSLTNIGNMKAGNVEIVIEAVGDNIASLMLESISFE